MGAAPCWKRVGAMWLRFKNPTPRLPVRGVELARGVRTRIRPFERADVDRWIAWPNHSDPLFEAYNPPTLSARNADLYYQQRIVSDPKLNYAIDDLQGELVGRISLREIDWRKSTSRLGISLNPGRLGQGFGTDALPAFLGYYFIGMSMSSMVLDVAAHNTRAQRLYENCGFEPYGEHWGPPERDAADLFNRSEFAEIRHLFRRDAGFVRPLLIDMVLRQDQWKRLQSAESMDSASDRPRRLEPHA